MRTKLLVACFAVILASGSGLVGRATAETPPLPARLDASKISVAKRAAKPTLFPKPTLVDRSPAQQPAHLTAEDWQQLRGSVAVMAKRPAASLAQSVSDAGDLSAVGNRITITPSSIPPGTKLSFVGSMAVSSSPSEHNVYGQAGSRVHFTFPSAPGGVYLVSCSGVGAVDYRFEAHTNSDIVRFEGHATPQDDVTHMVWTAPANLAGTNAHVKLQPLGLPSLGAGSYWRLLVGCDILRAA